MIIKDDINHLTKPEHGVVLKKAASQTCHVTNITFSYLTRNQVAVDLAFLNFG